MNEKIKEALAFAERWDSMPLHERMRIAPSIDLGRLIRELATLGQRPTLRQTSERSEPQLPKSSHDEDS